MMGFLPYLGVGEGPGFLWSLNSNFTRKVNDRVNNNKEKEERNVWTAFHQWAQGQILYRFTLKEELQCNINLLSFHGQKDLAYSSQIRVVSSNHALPKQAPRRGRTPG